MMHSPQFRFYLLVGCSILFSLPSPTRALQTVSIYSVTPTTEHRCVTQCVWGGYYSDVGGALSCGTPYANDCYCATDSVSASKASSFLSKCGSATCAAGDYSNDMTAMQSVYVSYCMNAGYTPPGATAWYTMGGDSPTATRTPTPGQRTSTGPQQTTLSTTTQLTLVTQTVAPSSAPGTTTPQSKLMALLLLAWLLALGVPQLL